MLASDLLELTGRFDHNEAEARARRVIENGSALAKLKEIVAAQGGDALIASSIMSQKLAAGSGCILLDVTVGSGAFMKTVPEAIELAQALVEIGEGMGRRVKALSTIMDRPLGRNIGHANDAGKLATGLATLAGAYTYGPPEPPVEPLLYASVTAADVAYA